MALLIGPGEEIFWRGYLQRRWQERFGAGRGFLFAAALYAAVHAGSGNVMLVLAAAVCGAVLGIPLYADGFGASRRRQSHGLGPGRVRPLSVRFVAQSWVVRNNPSVIWPIWSCSSSISSMWRSSSFRMPSRISRVAMSPRSPAERDDIVVGLDRAVLEPWSFLS